MPNRFWYPSLIVFISNTAVMTIELIAGRILAPVVGVSLFTWTSVIGVILAGMSLGNFFGGWLADHRASRRLLGLIFFSAALMTLAIIPLSDSLNHVFRLDYFPNARIDYIPIIIRFVLVTAVPFFIPSILLGTISPLVVKLSLHDLEHSGSLVGRIYASAAGGSILGTFLTGFYLISWLGVFQIVAVVTVILAALGILVGDWGRGRIPLALIVLGFIAYDVFYSPIALAINSFYAQIHLTAPFVALSSANPFAYSVCTRESDYYCIRVTEHVTDGRPVKYLVLDRLIHSIVDVQDPTRLTYPYERIEDGVIKRNFSANQPVRSLVLGGGGFSFPRYLEASFPNGEVTTIEIDPLVVQMARDQGWLPANSKIKVITQDARLGVEALAPDAKFDIIMLDTFNDYSVPYHLTTHEFFDALLAHLTPDGMLLTTIIDGKPGNFTFVRSLAWTLMQTVPHVYINPMLSDWDPGYEGNLTLVVVASRKELDMHNLPIAYAPHETVFWEFLTDMQFKDFLKPETLRVISDQYAPVDNFLAPVFEYAFR